MRGICGIFDFSGGVVEGREVDGMVRRMAVCETDVVGSKVVGAGGVGHLLKWSLAEDLEERQPMVGVCGASGGAGNEVLFVTDAVLFNRDELVDELKGGRLGSGSASLRRDREASLPRTPGAAVQASLVPDGQIVLAAYERWGVECVRRLQGRFAFAAWHPRERRLVCAVDQFCFRPVYYSRVGGRMAFASTLRGLFALPWVSRKIYDPALARFLIGRSAEPERTVYEQVLALPAAHMLEAKESGVRVWRYWQPDVGRRLRFRSADECLEGFRPVLSRAVSSTLRGKGAVGAYVSGGLDSSAVAAVAGQILAERGQRLQVIHELPPGGDPRAGRHWVEDESGFVRRFQASAPHIDFHYVPWAGGTFSFEMWDLALEEIQAPLRGFWLKVEDDADGGLPGLPDLGTVLYGLGGNGLVSLECPGSGYLAGLAVRGRWGRLLKEVAGRERVYGERARRTIRRHVVGPLWKALGAVAGACDVADGSALVRLRQACAGRGTTRSTPQAIRAPLRVEDGKPVYEDFPARGYWDPRALMSWMVTNQMCQNTALASNSVIVSDAGSMAYSPFFDLPLNEFCLAAGPDVQICGGWDRLLLRRAMQGVLPDEIVWRTNRGFPRPGMFYCAEQMEKALPEGIAAMRESGLVSEYLDLDAIEAEVRKPRGERQVGAAGLRDLVSVGWFLRWVDSQGGGGRESEG
jgi:asparagine synthase (glutamine-hydrolysing)